MPEDHSGGDADARAGDASTEDDASTAAGDQRVRRNGQPPADDAEATGDDARDGDRGRRVARGGLGFLLASVYTVLAVALTLAPPAALVGVRLNAAAWIGLVVVGLVAAGWAGLDAARADLVLRRLVVFVATGWLLLLALGVFAEVVAAVLLGGGPAATYLLRVLGFALATVAAAWMAFWGGWERARRRMGSGGLDRI